MLTLLFISRAIWSRPGDRIPRLMLACWVVASLCVPMQPAVPAVIGAVPTAFLEHGAFAE